MPAPSRSIPTGLAAIMLAATAQADIVVFQNDGTFVWIEHFPEAGTIGTGLDITQPATQPGDLTPTAFTWHPPSPDTSIEVSPGTINGSPKAQIALGDEVTVVGELGLEWSFTPPVTFGAGEMVGGGEDYGSSAAMWAFGFAIGDQLFLGENPIIGVQVELSGAVHYGWIDLLWTGDSYQPQAWAYESVPGVPISVPAPASAIIPLALATLTRRRRRHRSA